MKPVMDRDGLVHLVGFVCGSTRRRAMRIWRGIRCAGRRCGSPRASPATCCRDIRARLPTSVAPGRSHSDGLPQPAGTGGGVRNLRGEPASRVRAMGRCGNESRGSQVEARSGMRRADITQSHRSPRSTDANSARPARRRCRRSRRAGAVPSARAWLRGR